MSDNRDWIDFKPTASAKQCGHIVCLQDDGRWKAFLDLGSYNTKAEAKNIIDATEMILNRFAEELRKPNIYKR